VKEKGHQNPRYQLEGKAHLKSLLLNVVRMVSGVVWQ
jgi:hypothetical protein